MKILFARHAESEANLQHVISNRDIPHRLTPAGAAQADGIPTLRIALLRWDAEGWPQAPNAE